ncbi:MAG: response regulator transcription factor [Bacteroidetes bacterium]|nr:response regulator transcription factor [Bacteroidota bacterium]
MTEKINVAIADDQHLFRKGIISLLKEFDEINILFEAVDGKDLMDHLEKSEQLPDVILLDIEMPIMNGIDALKKIKSKGYPTKVIILTMHDEEEMVIHLIETGANGFLPKSEDIDNVVNAIKSVVESNYYFNDKFSKGMLRSLISNEKITPKFNYNQLSDIETEITRLICEELTNKEIAAILDLSVRSVDGHRERILKKIGAKNTAGIVMYAYKCKLIK